MSGYAMSGLTENQRAEIREIIKEMLRRDRYEILPIVREIAREHSAAQIVRAASPSLCDICGGIGYHGEHGTGKPIFCDCLHGQMAERLFERPGVIRNKGCA